MPYLSAHSAFASSAIAVLLLCSIAWRLPREPVVAGAPQSIREIRKSFVRVLLGAAWILLLVSTSIEAERLARSLFADGAVRGAAVSIWWSVYAVCLIALGFRFHAALRWAGLLLLALVAVKVLAFDTVVLPPVARVVAAITVGLVIIGAGVIYALLAGRFAQPADSAQGIEQEPQQSN